MATAKKETKAAEVKAEVKAAEETVKADAKAAKETVKKTAKKAATAAKKTVKKVAEKAETKAAAAKKAVKKAAPAAKKAAPAKKVAASDNVVLQFAGKDVEMKSVLEACKADYKAQTKKTAKNVTVYVKPEDGKAYYVVGDFNGEVAF